MKFFRFLPIFIFIFLAQSALAEQPFHFPRTQAWTTLARLLLRESKDYRIGDEWGKRPVTPEQLAQETEAFRRAAMATARVGGGTGFYLGEFNGFQVLATNHHVLENPGSCRTARISFPLLDVAADCIKMFGSWTDVDLAIVAIEFRKPGDREKLAAVARNFAFRDELLPEQALLTVGFGSADNPGRVLVANQDSDCKVFSGKNEFRFMADPDDFNPGPYKAWSFANGCDVSHGDSGSAMVDRASSNVVGLIWTGRIPKSPQIQSSAYLSELMAKQSEEIWKELSYAVPAPKIGEHLQSQIDSGKLEADTQLTLQAILAQ